MSRISFEGKSPALAMLGEDTIDKVDNPEKKEEKPAGKKAKGKGKTASQKKGTAKKPDKKAKAKEKGKPKAKASTPKGKIPEGYRLMYIEKKSKRVQILIQPSVHEAVQTKAKAEGISTNEAINEALRMYVGL